MVLRGAHAPLGAPASTQVSWRRRVHLWVADHQASVWTVGAIAVVAGAWQSVNLGSAPPPASGEGALVAAGWSIVHLGSAGDATFSSVGPSLAPVHLGAWVWATGALGRASSAIAAGRETILAAHVASIPLVWLLARRSGLARWAAGAAALVFAASPLAVALHRPVHGAGLAVPWMLAALVLASARRPRTLTGVTAGLCLAVAVLTEPSVVVVAPAVGWLLWRACLSPRRRRHRLLAGAAAFGVAWLSVTALVTSGAPEPALSLGLLDRIRLVAGGASSTMETVADGFDGRSVADLIGLDRVGVGACLLAAVVVPSVVPRFRPIGCAFWACAALTLVSGQPSWIIVVAMVPLGAVLLAAGAQLVWVWHLEARLEPRGQTHAASPAVSRLDAAVPIVFAAAAVALALAVPDWVSTHRGLAAADPAPPLASACDWVADNLNHGDRVIVDDTLWVDLVENGIPPSLIAGYGAVGDGSAWRSYGYIVSTPALRDAGPSPELASAVDRSLPIASVGDGDDRVEIRRIGVMSAAEAPTAEEAAQTEIRAAAGRALTANPGIDAPPAAVSQLRAGAVDERVTTVLATLAGAHRLEIGVFLRLPGEDVAGTPMRTVELATIDGRPIAARDPAVVEVVAFLGNQLSEFRPHQVSVVGRTSGEPRLRITFPIGQEDPE
ncbi:MAG TPA: hypothetical protein VFH30_19945 [Acidimicrobiales bacterium]|nr:hypothetical protein [Acidimicrobiales bacterium]